MPARNRKSESAKSVDGEGSPGNAGGSLLGFLHTVPDMMFVLTRDGTFSEFKAENPDELVAPPDKVIGASVHDLPVAPEVVQRILRAIRDALDSGTVQRVTYELEMPRGKLHYEAGIVAVDEDRVLAVVRDVTPVVNARRERDRHLAFLRQVIDINPNFVFAKDREGRFTLVNQAIADAYGTSVDKLLGKTDADFNPNAEEVAHFREADLHVLDSQAELEIPEEVITDAAGKTRWLRTVKRPILSEDGVAEQILGVAVDITDYRMAETRLRRAHEKLRDEQKQLEEKNVALKEILRHLEAERRTYEQELARQIHRVMIPELRKARKKCEKITEQDWDRLEELVEVTLGLNRDVFDDRFDTLSPREVEICAMVAEGMTTKQISQSLNLSVMTVSKHREQIRRKLGITNMRVNLCSYLRSRERTE